MNKLKVTLLMLLRGQCGYKRANYLRKISFFHHMGNKVLWKPYILPSEPYLVSIHNNVKVAAGVRLVTHDVIQVCLRDAGYPVRKDRVFYMGSIEIFDNVVIGANSTILYDVKIGPNAIVAAGSVVVKDVLEGTIVGGNPARVIGSVEELANRRLKELQTRPDDLCSMEEINKFFWGEEKSQDMCNELK